MVLYSFFPLLLNRFKQLTHFLNQRVATFIRLLMFADKKMPLQPRIYCDLSYLVCEDTVFVCFILRILARQVLGEVFLAAVNQVTRRKIIVAEFKWLPCDQVSICDGFCSSGSILAAAAASRGSRSNHLFNSDRKKVSLEIHN